MIPVTTPGHQTTTDSNATVLIQTASRCSAFSPNPTLAALDPSARQTGRDRIDGTLRVAYPCSRGHFSSLAGLDGRVLVQVPHGIPLKWRKANSCANSSACVEVAALPEGGAAVRDGKDPEGTHLWFDAAEWAGFLAAVKAGEFDPQAGE